MTFSVSESITKAPLQCNVSATFHFRSDTKTEDVKPRAESVKLDTVVNIIDSVTDEMAHHKEKVSLHLTQKSTLQIFEQYIFEIFIK